MSDSQPAIRTSEGPEIEEAPAWRIHAVLFVATIASVLATGVYLSGAPFLSRASFAYGIRYTAALLGILTVHEAGHYVAARIHKVDASLPYFIPLPLLGFGTMGAVIRMRGTIPTRRALLDIGASGPLAGLALAIPLYAWGVAHSTLVARTADMSLLGESLLTRALDHFVGPVVPPDQDIMLSPVAFGAWVGMLVTMVNLVPAGQLDGGHVAYALFGPRQDRFAVTVHRSMLAFALVSIGSYVARDVRAGFGLRHLGEAIGSSFFWLAWFEVLAILGTLTANAREDERDRARGGVPIRTRAVAIIGLWGLMALGQKYPSTLLWIAWFVGLALLLAIETKDGVLGKHALFDHPPTGAARLGPLRVAIAVVTLAFFVLLFMPAPLPL